MSGQQHPEPHRQRQQSTGVEVSIDSHSHAWAGDGASVQTVSGTTQNPMTYCRLTCAVYHRGLNQACEQHCLHHRGSIAFTIVAALPSLSLHIACWRGVTWPSMHSSLMHWQRVLKLWYLLTLSFNSLFPHPCDACCCQWSVAWALPYVSLQKTRLQSLQSLCTLQ